MMDTKDDFTGPVNLGNPNEITILELAKKIVQLTGSKSNIVFKNLPQDDPKRRCPDITLARNMLSWEPRVSLDEGLAKTITYFEDLLKKEKKDYESPTFFTLRQMDASRFYVK